MTTDAPLVLTEDVENVRVVRINRPDVRNAIDLPTRVVLAEALEAAGGDEAVRVIVLTGAGTVFCSGGDIASMQRIERTPALERAQAAQRVIRAIWNAPKPVIAAVEGAAFGAGMSLALACDRVVAGADAKFAATFSRVALAGDMGIFASLPARVGSAKAKQLLMFPEPILGADAEDLGLVDRAVEPGTVLDVAMAEAAQLATMAPQALATVKEFLAPHPVDAFAVLDREADRQADLFGTDDFAEGVAAFRERRTPQFGPAPSREEV